MVNGKACATASIIALAMTLAKTTAATEAMQKYASQEAALAALTGPSSKDGKTLASTGDEFDFEEIPADTPITTNVQVNISVAGETGQL
jgi:hypothetical protein